jgi:hypothetical protein
LVAQRTTTTAIRYTTTTTITTTATVAQVKVFNRLLMRCSACCNTEYASQQWSMHASTCAYSRTATTSLVIGTSIVVSVDYSMMPAMQLLSLTAVLTDHQSCVALSNVCCCSAVQGECYDLSRVEDDDEFLNTKKAMQLMGFSAEDQVHITKYL